MSVESGTVKFRFKIIRGYKFLWLSWLVLDGITPSFLAKWLHCIKTIWSRGRLEYFFKEVFSVKTIATIEFWPPHSSVVCLNCSPKEKQPDTVNIMRTNFPLFKPSGIFFSRHSWTVEVKLTFFPIYYPSCNTDTTAIWKKYRKLPPYSLHYSMICLLGRALSQLLCIEWYQETKHFHSSYKTYDLMEIFSLMRFCLH